MPSLLRCLRARILKRTWGDVSGTWLIRACALCLYQRRLLDTRPRDSLLSCRPLTVLEWRDRHRLSCFCRLVERLHNPHVLQSFLTRGLGLPVLEDAVGEVQQFGRELIPLPNALAGRLSVDRQRV